MSDEQRIPHISVTDSRAASGHQGGAGEGAQHLRADRRQLAKERRDTFPQDQRPLRSL